MDELIKRLEAATGPDRELDTALLQYAPDPTAGLCACTGACAPERLGYCTAVPNYTASIDAALTLVPEGWFVSRLHQWVVDNFNWSCDLAKKDLSLSYPVTAEDCETAALAICIAALRARGDA